MTLEDSLHRQAEKALARHELMLLQPWCLLDVLDELRRCREVCQSLADRVAKQSELLSRRAEKENPHA